MPKLAATFLGFACLSSFLGCGVKVQIDNSSQSTWEIQMDGKTLSIPPQSFSEMSLDKGNHTLTVKSLTDSAKDSIIQFQVEDELFIHAPGQRYLVWKDLYGGQQNRASLLNDTIFELDSMVFKVDVSWLDTNAIVHEVKWDFGIGETFDEKIVLRADQNEGIRTRLVRKQDFKEEYLKRASH